MAAGKKTVAFLGAWTVIIAVVATVGWGLYMGARWAYDNWNAGLTMTRPDSSIPESGTKPSTPATDSWGDWGRNTIDNWSDWLQNRFPG